MYKPTVGTLSPEQRSEPAHGWCPRATRGADGVMLHVLKRWELPRATLRLHLVADIDVALAPCAHGGGVAVFEVSNPGRRRRPARGGQTEASDAAGLLAAREAPEVVPVPAVLVGRERLELAAGLDGPTAFAADLVFVRLECSVVVLVTRHLLLLLLLSNLS